MQKIRGLIYKSLFVVALLYAYYGFSQFIGNPIVYYYHPLEYGGYSQNWFIEKTDHGVLFFANGDGVLEYDGYEWKIHKIGKQVTPSALLFDKEILWVGSKNELGFLMPNNKGEYEYNSLINLIPDKYQNFGFVLRIHKHGKYIYFSAYESIFVWDGKQMHVYKTSSNTNIFKVNDLILGFENNQGLFVFDGINKNRLINGEFFRNKLIRQILPYDSNKYLIITRKDGLFLASFHFQSKNNIAIEDIEFFESDCYNLAAKDIIYHAIFLHDGSFALATMLGGTYLMNKEGLCFGKLDRSTGIPNETHTYLYQDYEHNLWIATDNGIAKVALASNFTYFNERSNLYGSVIEIKKFKNHIIAGTWQGLFVIPLKHNEKFYNQSFVKIPEIKSQCWKINVIEVDGDTFMIAATSDGLYKIDTQFRIYLINDESYYSLAYSNAFPNLLFAGRRNGIDIFKIQNNTINLYKELNLAKDLAQTRHLLFDNEEILWIGTDLSEIFSLTIQKNLNDYAFYLRDHSQFLFEANSYNFHKINNSIFVISDQNIYLINKNLNNQIFFEELSNFRNFLIKFLQAKISIIFYNEIHNCIYFQIKRNDNFRRYTGVLKNNGKDWFADFESFGLFPQYDIHSIYADQNGLVWLGCDDGIFVYDQNRFVKRLDTFNAYIRKVEILGPSEVLKLIQQTNDVVKLLPKQNNIRFTFSANFYIKDHSLLFRYKLEGFDKEWSTWTRNRNKEYTNLSPGNYTFHIQAKDAFNQLSEISSFKLYIKRPWYLTYYAFGIYALIVGLSIYGINRLTHQHLIRTKQRLEAIIENRTREIAEQKLALEREKEKSDLLLLNILPIKIAEDLKNSGYSRAEFYQSATVLFTDFAGFTRLAENEEPQELVNKLERIFLIFDDIVIRNRLEKIKTIGDSHMSVGGIPVPNKTHLFDAVLAAIEMVESMEKIRKKYLWANNWNLRIGIHTGSLIAGIIGKRKFAYDVWGDTVNMSSRLQETSEKDRINISREVFQVIEPYFECEYRGKITLKHKGPVDLYFVNRLKAEYSKNPEGTKPNVKFREMYWNLMKCKSYGTFIRRNLY